MIQGGFNMGKTMTDTCDVIGKLDNPSLMPQPTNAAGGPAPVILDPRCHREGGWLPQVKLLGSHPLPWGFRVSGTYQTLVLDPMTNGTSNLGFIANYVATNAVIAPSLGRPLSGGAANVTVNLLAAGEQYDKRTHQMDLRFSRTFRDRAEPPAGEHRPLQRVQCQLRGDPQRQLRHQWRNLAPARRNPSGAAAEVWRSVRLLRIAKGAAGHRAGGRRLTAVAPPSNRSCALNRLIALARQAFGAGSFPVIADGRSWWARGESRQQ